MDQKEIITSLKRQKSEIHKKYQVKQIVLFGSFARGDEKENSDIDIYAEFEPKQIIWIYPDYQLNLRKCFTVQQILQPHMVFGKR